MADKSKHWTGRPLTIAEKKAIAVKPIPKGRTDLVCPECSAKLRLRNSRFGLFYGCTSYPKCKGTHGAHPDGKPKGKPGDKATKEARIRAHTEFDKLWRGHRMSREHAYLWMREAMDMTEDEAHIGNFSIGECETLIRKLGER